MKKVDIHIIRPTSWTETTTKWHKQCLDSLQSEPVNIHFVDYVPGDIRAARFAGFSQGSCEYVSFVDCDDWVEPGIFQLCTDVLDSNPGACGAFTRSHRINVNCEGVEVKTPLRPYHKWPLPTNGILTDIHQLAVMRRDDCLRVYTETYDDIPPQIHEMTWVYWEMARVKPWIAMPEFGYNWRDHVAGAHHIFNTEIAESLQ